MKKSRITWILGLAAAGALILGACSSDSDDNADNGDDSSVTVGEGDEDHDDDEKDHDDDDDGGGDISDDLRQEGIDSMLAQGMDQEAAECMVDGMIDVFGSDIADMVDNDEFEPTAEQTADLIEITTDCGALEEVLDAADTE